MSSSLTRMFGFAKRMHSSTSAASASAASAAAASAAAASSTANSIISIYCNVCNKGYHEPAVVRIKIHGEENEYKVTQTIDKKYRFENIRKAPVDYYTYH